MQWEDKSKDDKSKDWHFYSDIESGPSAVLLCSCDLAQSIAKTEALRNFLFAYFLQTYCLWKLSSVSFSTSRSCPGSSCSSV